MEVSTSVDNLRLKFPGTKSLLFKDFSLSIKKGEKVLFLGPSGCGKSTILQVLTGLIPHAIDVPLRYEAIQKPASWGYVFQDPDTQFCMPYVDEELAFVLENQSVQRRKMPELIDHYLQQVGLTLDNPHTKIQALSQGMKQRLAIASVLALKPDILFLDEPTALLDPEGTEQIWETIKQVGKHKTVVIVEHKIDLIVDFVDRVILFNDQGEVMADGDKETIFRDHHHELVEYGIWYPGVWEEYASNTLGNKLTNLDTIIDQDELITQNKLSGQDSHSKVTNPVIHMQDFKGYRGKEIKIEISEAKVYPGEWVCVVGENGAGKSTLLLALMQLLKTSGSYQLSAIPINQIKELSTKVGFVFQNPEFQFVTNTVFDEVAYSLKNQHVDQQTIKHKVNQVLHFFELVEKKEAHPYQCSMGQKRRLSVATAIVRDQDVLLLDEPTFGQDAKNTFSVLEKIEHCRQQGTTVIMVTHDLHIIDHFATRVWTIEQGKLVLDVETKSGRSEYGHDVVLRQLESV